MPFECGKAAMRRLHEPGFGTRYFVGDGIDIGGGYDPLWSYRELFPAIRSCRNWDLADGDAQEMAGVPDDTFDFVHCVVPGQLVATPSGPMPIEKVRAGDRVLGYSGYVGVRRVYRMPYRGGVMRLETPQGVAVVTTNHPIATPLGWVQANQLRPSSQVATCPAKVQAPDLIDGRHIFSRITRPAALLAERPMLVVVERAALRKGQHNLSLATLPNEIRNGLAEHDTTASPAAMHDHALADLGVRRRWASRRATMAHAAGEQNRRHAIEDHVTGVDDLNLRLHASRSDTEADAALAIEYSGEPRPIRYEQLHDLKIQPYRGEVWNLETEDGTFVVGGTLTHNSSHCLEHMVDPFAALAHWFRILRPGGHLIVLVPDEDLYEQGVWPSTWNSDHKHSFTLYKHESWSPVSTNVFELIGSLGARAEPIKCQMLDVAYRWAVSAQERTDQTQFVTGECAIEFIVRKLGKPRA